MFKFTLDNVEYKVTFHHKKVENDENNPYWSYCVIQNSIQYKKGYCFAKQLNRENARRISLKKALNNFGFNHDQRKIVWDAYWKAKQPPYREFIFTMRTPRNPQFKASIITLIKLKLYIWTLKLFPIMTEQKLAALKIHERKIKK